MEGGRTPTTPTISSIIAGVQAQEAIKHLHGMTTMAGRGWIFEGLSGESYSVEYQRKDECYSHDMLESITSLDGGVADITGRQLLTRAREELGGSTVLELAHDMIEKLVCASCQGEEPVFSSISSVSASQVSCPNCGDVRREVVTFYKIAGDEPFLDQPLSALGVPPFDIVTARNGDRCIGYELAGDARDVLGKLAGSEEEVEWT